MAEQVRSNEAYASWRSNGPINPDHYPDVVMGYDPEELAVLSREVAQSTAQVIEARKPVAVSWAGGGQPKQEYMGMWTEQAMKEILGQQTAKPYAEYFETVSMEAPRQGVMTPNREVQLGIKNQAQPRA